MSAILRCIIVLFLAGMIVLALYASAGLGIPPWLIASAAVIGVLVGLVAQRRETERVITVLACCAGILYSCFGWSVFGLGLFLRE